MIFWGWQNMINFVRSLKLNWMFHAIQFNLEEDRIIVSSQVFDVLYSCELFDMRLWVGGQCLSLFKRFCKLLKKRQFLNLIDNHHFEGLLDFGIDNLHSIWTNSSNGFDGLNHWTIHQLTIDKQISKAIRFTAILKLNTKFMNCNWFITGLRFCNEINFVADLDDLMANFSQFLWN